MDYTPDQVKALIQFGNAFTNAYADMARAFVKFSQDVAQAQLALQQHLNLEEIKETNAQADDQVQELR